MHTEIFQEKPRKTEIYLRKVSKEPKTNLQIRIREKKFPQIFFFSFWLLNCVCLSLHLDPFSFINPFKLRVSSAYTFVQAIDYFGCFRVLGLLQNGV
ncbi:hypothetical protein V6Z12_A05G143400 [Gossypium hirsutum]